MNYDRIFAWELPSRIEFGLGAAANLADRVKEYGTDRVLLVADPGLPETVLDRVTAPLDEGGVSRAVFRDIEPEPDARGVEAGRELARSEGCEVVVGVGGGSTLDTAKAIAVMLRNEGHIRDYAGQDLIPEPGAPVIAMPTTAGTGSEVTIWSVIAEKDEKKKYGVGGRYMTATLALCDPELTVTLPPHITATSGIDALAHALESYVNKATQPVSEALSLQAMQLVAKSLRLAVVDGENLEARSDMLLASLMAGMAFNSTRLGIAHALAMPLGAGYKIPHSTIIAVLLPEVMRFNLVGNLEKFVRIAGIFGERPERLPVRDAAELSVGAILKLYEDVGISDGLARYGVREEHLRDLAEAGIQTGNIPVNPRKPTVEDLVEIMGRSMETPVAAWTGPARDALV
jgi:alcohol dehydrogenase class IV